MQGLLPSLVVAVLIELTGSGIPHCLAWSPSLVQRLCLCGVVVEIVVVYYGLLPVDNCQ